MTRMVGYGLAAVLACLLTLGCGGGGGGEPTVAQTLYDELQAELDAALADLAAEREAKTTAEGEAERLEDELETAQGEAARLTTQLATAEASVADLTTQLATATGSVTDLTAQLATATADVARLTGELETATGNVTRLEGLIGAATDPASATGSLHAQLNAANAEVARLEGLIGAATDTANAAQSASLHAQLNAAKARVTELEINIGAATDAASATGSLHAQLNAARARVTELETLIGDATNPTATSLRGQIAKLTVDLAAEKAKVTALESNLQSAQTDLTAAQQAAQRAREEARQAQQQAQQQVQGQEANQRAQNLKAAFPGGTATMEDLPTFPTTTPSPVDMTVTSGRLKLERGGYGDGTLSGNGLRSTTMPLTRGTDAGKMVVYTDRELSRSVLTHFGSARNETDMTRFDLEAPIALTAIPHFTTTPPVTTQWRISHNAPTSVAGESDGADPPTYSVPSDATPDNTKTAASYTGYLYGASGRFVCVGGTDCKVQVAPTYGGTVGSNNRFALQSVAVTATSGTLYFEPGSSTYQLYEGGPVGADTEYMVFGYWREDPTSAAGVYQFKVFAEAVAPTGRNPDFTGISATSPLTYDGVAVGAYVEQDPNDPVDTHRQGEFTADVFLEASSATAVEGTIDDFVATPTGGSAAPRTADRWVLTLDDDNEVQLNLAGGGEATQGSWTHNFVPAHANAAGSDVEPPAVTGVFDARIVDFVHILGAYGAEKR